MSKKNGRKKNTQELVKRSNGTNGRGRPSIYTDELAAEICRLVGQGVSLRKIAEMEGMPDTTTIMAWKREKDSFSLQYDKARADCLEYWSHQILDIADDVNGVGFKDRTLQIESRKWLMSKLNPRQYGDRIEQLMKVEGEVRHQHSHAHVISCDVPRDVSLKDWLEFKQQQRLEHNKQDTIEVTELQPEAKEND